MSGTPISFHGALFEEGRDVSPAIARAANIAKTYGLALVKARTPVDTGNLKSKWEAKFEDNGIRWSNETYYAGFVEHGTRKMAPRNMLGDSLPDIEQVFYKELVKELGKTLAFETIDTAPPPTYANSIKPANPAKYPEVGKDTKPTPPKPSGLGKRKYSKDYLFANPRDILSQKAKDAVNAARPKWQKAPIN